MDGTATDDELVEGVVAELKPFREQWDGTTPDVAAVTQGVWNEINSLRQMIPSLYDRSVITATRDDARAILDAIESLQDMLAAAGRELRMRPKLDSDRPPVFEALDDVRKECERAVTSRRRLSNGGVRKIIDGPPEPHSGKLQSLPDL